MNNLDRFITAQKKDYDKALKEIQNEKKLTHWSWYIFPQLKGLGSSSMVEYYGVEGLTEAILYLNNEYFKNNLIQISQELLNLNTNNTTEVLGYPDDLKVRFFMTLFYCANPQITVFEEVIKKIL